MAEDKRIAAAEPAGLFNRIAFRAFWYAVSPVLRTVFRIRVENAPRIDGPYVIAGNHSSHLDPALLGAVSRQRIIYLMTAVVYRSPRAGWFYRFARAIPLEVTGGNRSALRAARETLRRGEVIGIFPEGGLSRDGGPVLGNPGAVSLVLGEKVPVVPVGIIGAYESLPPHGKLRPKQVTIRFGDPISHDELVSETASKKERFRLATRRIMDEVAALTGTTSREAELERIGTEVTDLALNA